MTTLWEVRRPQPANYKTLAPKISTIGLVPCHLLWGKRDRLLNLQEAAGIICTDPRPRSREGKRTSTNHPRLGPISIRANMHSPRPLSVNLSLILPSMRRTTQLMRLAHPPATPQRHRVQVSTNTIPPRLATPSSLCLGILTAVVVLTMVKGAAIAWSLREEGPNPLSITKGPLHRRWVLVSPGPLRLHRPTRHNTTLGNSVGLRTTETI